MVMRKLHKSYVAVMMAAIFAQGCAPVTSTSIPREGSQGGGGVVDVPGTDPGTTDPGHTDPPTTNPPTNPGGQEKTQNVAFAASRPVDIMLVIDNSQSMESDSLELASRMTDFVRELKQRGIDWQLCLTTTDVDDSTNTYAWKVGKTTKYQLKKNDLEGKTDREAVDIFTNSIRALFKVTGSGDERGVAALYRHAASKASRDQACYRKDAVLSTIVLSDEDERSYGGNRAYFDSKESQPHGPSAVFNKLEKEDLPSVYVDKIQSLGIRNLIAHSIITDSVSCRDQQRANYGKDGVSVGHIGTVYKELSRLTDGHVGSICDANYSRHLLDFADAIDTSFNSILLSCAPQSSSLAVTSPTKVVGRDFTFFLNGDRLEIRSYTDDAFNVEVKYTCQ